MDIFRNRPASKLYLKTFGKVVKNMTDVVVTTFVKDKLRILSEKDIDRMAPLIEEIDAAFELMDTLNPLIEEEQRRTKEAWKNRSKKKKL